MAELIPLSAQIGDRAYRIKVEPKDEALVRKTLQQINDKIMELKSLYVGKDMQDYVSMTMIWYATQQPTTTAAVGAVEDPTIRQGLAILEGLIENGLQQ
ncbi:MAG: cell division protein ZapA [Bacteroidetes bacterium]|nr:cell division protein ZapA [Bacteroidota bacterium]